MHAYRKSIWMALLLGALLAGPVRADEDEAGGGASEPVDFMPRVLDYHEQLKTYAEPPLEEGPGRILYKAWKADLKSRSKRLASKSKHLTRETYWDLDDDSGAALRVKPKQWGAFVRRVGSLYTELGGGVANYGKVRVSPDHEIRRWDKAHPEPRIRGLTPAGSTLVRLRRRLAWLRSQGLPVPVHLFREIDRYVILQTQEIEARREAHRRWEEDREHAHREIRARYAEARVLVEASRDELAAEMAILRALMADLQEVEEARLRELVEAFPERDPVHASAKKYFKTMVTGRKAALRFSDSRTSRYGTLLNQKWTAPRKHLLSAIKKADKRQSEAEAAGAEDAQPAGKAPAEKAPVGAK